MALNHRKKADATFLGEPLALLQFTLSWMMWKKVQVEKKRSFRTAFELMVADNFAFVCWSIAISHEICC